MASLWRRAVDRIRQRDPEFDALRRAGRAAIVVPVAAAVGFAVGGGSQTPLLTIFGEGPDSQADLATQNLYSAEYVVLQRGEPEETELADDQVVSTIYDLEDSDGQ